MTLSFLSSLDPNVSQKQAADPRVSAWVSASAGTGKTKVLTDRLLNLMLTGTDPQKILCLTFTKAAAAEMEERLFDRLRQWVLLSDADLTKALYNLTSEPPSLAMLSRARSLFTHALDLPHGMKIMTIHSFCQAILGRFPLEAQLSPHFSILDEGAASLLLRQASRTVFNRLSDFPLQWGISRFFGDSTFQETLEELLDKRYFLRFLSHKFPRLQDYAEEVKSQLEIGPDVDLFKEEASVQFLQKNCYDLSFDKIGLLTLLQEDSGLPPLLSQWLEASPEQRMELYEEYTQLFHTKKGTILKKLKVNHPGEAERLYQLNQRRAAIEIAQKTLTIYAYGHEIFEAYQALKEEEGVLDYDDLIEKTIQLLQTPDTAAWVLYKLDGGIDHILIDEAQDTNPHQWEVITKLAEDLFRPDKSHRTLFVVGDAKQSIYSFQGAKPEDFIDLRTHFAQRSAHIGQIWRDVDLTVSFRSTQEVLAIVDKLFSCPTRQEKLLSSQKIVHHPYRQCLGGKVSRWPLIFKEEGSAAEEEPWALPVTQHRQSSPQQVLCTRIALQIRTMLSQKKVVPSTGKPIEPRDILILLKQRGSLALTLIQELKKHQIPVAGADRFLLMTHIAAQDLLVLGEFLVQPLNDLALATVLRSPFIGMGEEDLENLCYNRQDQSLWSVLLSRVNDHPIYEEAAQWLKKVFSKQDYLPPYELYHFILHDMGGKEKLLARLSVEAEDTLTEFLNQALQYEHQGAPTLQGFLSYLEKNFIEIKRDSANRHLNQVRIMTIHGSKGLQAPIVILPEKVDSRDKINKLIWSLDPKGQPQFVLIRPPIPQDTPLTIHLKELQQWREEAEDMRLLYVALTRAQDHLYMCGYAQKATLEAPEDSWYAALSGIISEAEPWEEGEVTAPNGPQEGKVTPEEPLLPVYFHHQIKLETVPLVDDISSPDLPSEVWSKSSSGFDKMLRPEALRGIIIHKFLEELAEISADQREEKIAILLENEKRSQEHREAIQASLHILTQFPEFFGPNSVPEVEILSTKGKLMRLDRVCFGKKPGDPVWILDYKTTQIPPVSVEETPPTIRQQLEVYKEALQPLYPESIIETYILWTHIGRLDKVS